jgi:cytidylate kinase
MEKKLGKLGQLVQTVGEVAHLYADQALSLHTDLIPSDRVNIKSDRLLKVVFTGKSGSGKTTSARFFGKHTNFLAFEGDTMIFQGFIDNPDIAEKVFGRRPEAGENPYEYAYSNYMPLTYEKEKGIFESMRDYVEGQLAIAYNDPTMDFESCDNPALRAAIRYQPKDANGRIMLPKGLAAEMCAFHRGKHLLRETDFVVYLKNPSKQLRKNRLLVRENMQAFVKMGAFDEIVDIREAVQGDLLRGVEPDLIVMNNYGEYPLVRGQNRIIEKMGKAKLLGITK